MKSPFPGMDPYLEASWPDVHVKLVAFIAEALMPLLPAGLRAKSEEDVEIESSDPDDDRDLRPDVVVVESGRRRDGGTSSAGLMVPEPVRVHIARSVPRNKRVIVIDSRQKNRVVTAIEILSPSNKASGASNRAYRKKLDLYREGGVSVVEIDLLRWPTRERLEIDQSHLPPEMRAPYMISVCRAWEPDDWDLYPVSIRLPIPPFPVPLRRTDPEVVFDLQPLIDRVYAAADYGSEIDYSQPPTPALEAEDAAWAKGLIESSTGR